MNRLVALLLLAGACGPPPCPPRTLADDVRARAVQAAAAGTRAGQGLTSGEAALCFGGLERGSVLPDGVVLLSDALERAAAAARLLHLRVHVADGLHRFPAAGVPCERQMEAAIAAEARAIAVEIEACEELRCDAAPYSFAAEVLAAAPAERALRVRARLQEEHPGDGLDGLLRRYRARCEEVQ